MSVVKIFQWLNTVTIRCDNVVS